MITPPNRLAAAEAAVQAGIGCDPMRAKRILRARRIFIRGISITMEHWPSWRWPEQSLPNHPRVFELTAYIYARRQGKNEGVGVQSRARCRT